MKSKDKTELAVLMDRGVRYGLHRDELRKLHQDYGYTTRSPGGVGLAE